MYYLSEIESRRIVYVRAMLVICVVFVHSYSTGFQFISGNIDFAVPAWVDIVKHIFSREIGSTGVPYFFLISSILLYRKSFNSKENLRRKIRTLFFPYFLFNLIWIIGFFLLQLIPAFRNFFPDPSTVILQWKPYNWLDAFLGLDGYPMLYPLWFLRDLLLLNLIACPFRKLVEKAPKAYMILFLSIWVFIPESDGFFRESLQSLCFWGIGCCLVCLNIHITAVDCLPKYLYAIIYLFLAAADETVYRLFPGTELFCIVHRVQILSGFGLWFGFFARIKFEKKAERLLLLLSAFSFNIYLLHENFLTAAKKLCAILLPVNSFWLMIEYFIIPLVIVLFCIALSTAVKKLFPELYRSIFGQRRSAAR